ncbi:MAG TPA: uroporphyrinogen decarboxylase family protein [Spirochaetia bacterium]|nr:uroporphyrinogen decarboxylase family protein [Spirochaetia bacterium]
MSRREAWKAVMEYGELSEVPALWWDPWDETRERWTTEGMPAGVDPHAALGTIRFWINLEVDLGLRPGFPQECLEETADSVVRRLADGTVQRSWKHGSSIPQYVDHALKTARDWPDFKRRLRPDAGRIPPDLADRARALVAADDLVLIDCGSLMGWIRNWMGLEGMSYLLFDDPDAFRDMVATIADLACWAIDQTIPRLPVLPDAGILWEDMCGKNGPLIDPELVSRYVAPHYRRIRQRLDRHGVHLLGVDCDGDITGLLPVWLESGVNLHMPVEIGTWKADPMALRRRHGRELRMVGGIDKRELEKGPAAIDREVARRMPLVRDGGFIPMPDHYITPQTSLADFRYYLSRIGGIRIDAPGTRPEVTRA